MKIKIFKLVFLCVVVVLLSMGFIGCNLENYLGDGVLELQIGAVSRSINWLPDIDMDITTYTIRGEGPNEGDSFIEEGFSGGLFTKESLQAGDWDITVDGHNDSGTKIGSSTVRITIRKNQKTNATITVRPLSGAGTLDISVNWSDSQGILVDPKVYILIQDKDGNEIPAYHEPIPLTIGTDGISASGSVMDIPVGWYVVQVEMYEGIPGSEDEPVWQGVYTLRIVNDEITSGIVVISEEEFNLGIGSVALTIEEEMDNPFDVSFTGLPESVKEEEDVTVVAVGTYGDEATFRWFVNGRSRGINANEFIFSSNSAGLYNISLLVSDGEVVGGHRQSVEVLQATTEVAADLAALEIGYAGEDTSANVTENVILPVTGLNGTHITWNSSDESLVNCSGLVTRPAYSAGDAAVQLTATVTRGTVAETKSFILTVAKLPQTDAEAVAADKELLEVGFTGLDSADNVTQNVNLPSSGTNGTTITWSSSAVETISTSGVVTRPDYTGESDVTVVLTATISRGGISETKTFSLTVKIILQEQTVTFVSNGGSLVDPQTVYWGYTVGEPTAPTRVGFSFEGWFTDSELTDQWDFIADYVDGDISLYAKWGDGYRISFNSQGGLNPSPTYITVGYGLAYGELANTAKVGHTFQGWHVDPEGEGGEVTPDTIVAINADHILYAVWQPNTQTITFDAQGGFYDGSDTMIVTYGQMYGELPIATRESYNFAGWWTGLDGTGSLVTESTVFTGTIDRTLYAKWTFDVIVGPAGGLVFYDNPNYEIDGWRYLEAAPYGWYDKETHSAGTYIGDDDPYIQWGAQGYTVDPPATATGIGTGAKNTANIISYHDTLWTLYPEKGDYYANPKDYYEGNDGTVAAKICDEFSIENEGVIYDDWFLPSKDELNFMYQNLQMQSKGGFSWNYYWSSSESNDEFAWIHEFQNGGQYDYAFGGRANAYKVRPVRVF